VGEKWGVVFNATREESGESHQEKEENFSKKTRRGGGGGKSRDCLEDEILQIGINEGGKTSPWWRTKRGDYLRHG